MCSSVNKTFVFSNSCMEMIWYLYPACKQIKVLLLTLSKSINGFRKAQKLVLGVVTVEGVRGKEGVRG